MCIIDTQSYTAELFVVLAALIAVGGGLLTVYQNEKNKRVFHLIENTWEKKHELFTDLITKVYDVYDIHSTLTWIRKISFEKNVEANFIILYLEIVRIEEVEGKLVISNKDYERFRTLGDFENSDNITFLNYVKTFVDKHHFGQILRINRDIIEILSKLKLVILDETILKDIFGIVDGINEKGKEAMVNKNFDFEEISNNMTIKMKGVEGKMRKELVETLKIKKLDDFISRLE